MSRKILRIAGQLAGLALLVAAAAASAAAQDVADCSNAISQSAMTQCAYDDWQAADAELNAAYRDAIAAMRETDGYLADYLKGAENALRDAQRAWIPFREKSCEAYGFLARGGTMEPMPVFGCQADMTRQRTRELRQLVTEFSG
ncbi:MAG: lysozyme inhibitor LprI family protein [Roseibium sp.]